MRTKHWTDTHLIKANYCYKWFIQHVYLKTSSVSVVSWRETGLVYSRNFSYILPLHQMC